MRRSKVLVLGPIVAACAGTACSSSDPATVAPLSERLQADTGVAWVTHSDEGVRFGSWPPRSL